MNEKKTVILCLIIIVCLAMIIWCSIERADSPIDPTELHYVTTEHNGHTIVISSYGQPGSQYFSHSSYHDPDCKCSSITEADKR